MAHTIPLFQGSVPEASMSFCDCRVSVSRVLQRVADPVITELLRERRCLINGEANDVPPPLTGLEHCEWYLWWERNCGEKMSSVASGVCWERSKWKRYAGVYDSTGNLIPHRLSTASRNQLIFIIQIIAISESEKRKRSYFSLARVVLGPARVRLD